MTNAYKAIHAESDLIRWPEGYREDLTVHDRRRLDSEDPPEQFGWVLGVSGTLLLDARMSGYDRRAYMGHLRSSPGGRIYFWDGRTLNLCRDPEDLAARMEPHAETIGHASY